MATIYKTVGCGNDFLIFDATGEEFTLLWSHKFNELSRKEVAKRLCDRNFGIGADGLVFLEATKNPEWDFQWDFYNSDGSVAEMCGNATRCVAMLAKYLRLVDGNSMKFGTLAGTIQASVIDQDTVQVNMPRILKHAYQQEMTLENESIKFDFINTGVPHVVLKQDSICLSNESIEIYKKIRHHKNFLPSGTNVTLYSVVDKNHIRSASFERGVEGITLACGTGAVAAATSYSHLANSREPIRVSLPGGDLIIKPDISGPLMTGPAQVLARIDWLGK